MTISKPFILSAAVLILIGAGCQADTQTDAEVTTQVSESMTNQDEFANRVIIEEELVFLANYVEDEYVSLAELLEQNVAIISQEKALIYSDALISIEDQLNEVSLDFNTMIDAETQEEWIDARMVVSDKLDNIDLEIATTTQDVMAEIAN